MEDFGTVINASRERRRLLDHKRYMQQREARLEKRYEQYHSDIEASREYYRNYRKKRIAHELRQMQVPDSQQSKK